MIDRRIWTEQEDEVLRQCVQELGVQRWTQVSQKITNTLPSFCRNGKQCRQRWFNHLNQDIRKDQFSQSEHQIFMKIREQVGNKWTEIARKMPGRTQNSLKNHYYSKIRKAIRSINRLLADKTHKIKPLTISFVNRVVASHIPDELKNTLINSMIRLGDSGGDEQANLTLQHLKRLVQFERKQDKSRRGRKIKFNETAQTTNHSSIPLEISNFFNVHLIQEQIKSPSSVLFKEARNVTSPQAFKFINSPDVLSPFFSLLEKSMVCKFLSTNQFMQPFREQG